MDKDWNLKLQNLANIAATIESGKGLHSFSESIALGNYERLKRVHRIFCLSIDLINKIKSNLGNAFLQEASDRLLSLFIYMRDCILTRLRDEREKRFDLAQRQSVAVSAELSLPC